MQVRRGTASSWTSTNPTLAAGELGFETDTGKFKIGTGSSTWNSLLYAGGGQSSLTTYQYTATGGQTTFSGPDSNSNTLSYTVGAIQVYLNGALLANTADYTASNGTSVVLTAGALVGDSLTILSLATFDVANTYTQAQANALFIADTIVDAKGDIIAATASDTVARLAVGANDLLLTAASGQATGLKYTGGWTTFTPTWSNLTVGNASVNTGAYCQIGKTVFVKVHLVLGSTSTVGSTPYLSHPVTGAGIGAGLNGTAQFLDAGIAYYLSMIDVNSTQAILVLIATSAAYASQAGINSTTPFTWGTNDEIKLSYYYEVA
jgi:hypothetical protein